MKKVILVFLVAAVALNMCACFGFGNDEAEVNEVKSYLKQYYWYHYFGGTYNMGDIYEFNSDGTYSSARSYSVSSMDSYSEGTYEIDTNKNKIRFANDNNTYEWTYTLSDGSLKLFDSSSNEYTKLDKD